jgi:hypothetical protein
LHYFLVEQNKLFPLNWLNLLFGPYTSIYEYVQGSWVSATSAFPSASCWHKVAIAALLWCRLIWTILERESVHACALFFILYSLEEGCISIPSSLALFLFSDPGSLQRGPLI